MSSRGDFVGTSPTSGNYIPLPVPADDKDLSLYVSDELLRLGGIVNGVLEGGSLPPHSELPQRYREGMTMNFSQAVGDGVDKPGVWQYKEGRWWQFLDDPTEVTEGVDAKVTILENEMDDVQHDVLNLDTTVQYLANTKIPQVEGKADTNTSSIVGLENRFPIQTTDIVDLAVTTDKLADDSVTVDKIAPNAIISVGIADLNVTTNKLSDLAVTTVKIDDEAITTTKVAPDAITTDKIVNSAITTDKISDDSVTGDKIDETTDVIVNSLTSNIATSNINGIRYKIGSFPSTLSTEEIIDVSAYEGRVYDSTGSFVDNGSTVAFTQLIGVMVSPIGPDTVSRPALYPTIKSATEFGFLRDAGYVGTQYFSFIAIGV